MNECLVQLAQDYVVVKFCKIRSAEINLSEKFVSSPFGFDYLKSMSTYMMWNIFVLEKNWMPGFAYLSERRAYR